MADSDFKKYRYDVYSQNGEDGIIQELILRLKENISLNPWCVEFGAWDGVYCSNTFNLVKNGWNAFYIEGNKERYKDLKKNCGNLNKVLTECRFVEKDKDSKNSLDNILGEKCLPEDFEILSIDVDSFDLEIWESLTNYSPKIVIIEINGRYLPGIYKWHSGKPGNKFGGNSFSSTLMVAKKKGYQLICQHGNMIFIKKEFLKDIKLSQKFVSYPELLFDDKEFIEIEENDAILKSIKFLKKTFKKIIELLKK